MGKKQQPSPPAETFLDAAQLPAAEILAGELVSVVARNVESGRLSEHAISQAWATALARLGLAAAADGRCCARGRLPQIARIWSALLDGGRHRAPGKVAAVRFPGDPMNHAPSTGVDTPGAFATVWGGLPVCGRRRFVGCTASLGSAASPRTRGVVSLDAGCVR